MLCGASILHKIQILLLFKSFHVYNSVGDDFHNNLFGVDTSEVEFRFRILEVRGNLRNRAGLKRGGDCSCAW